MTYVPEGLYNRTILGRWWSTCRDMLFGRSWGYHQQSGRYNGDLWWIITNNSGLVGIYIDKNDHIIGILYQHRWISKSIIIHQPEIWQVWNRIVYLVTHYHNLRRRSHTWGLIKAILLFWSEWRIVLLHICKLPTRGLIQAVIGLICHRHSNCGCRYANSWVVRIQHLHPWWYSCVSSLPTFDAKQIMLSTAF